MRPIHPGEVLRDELEELDMSANALAIELRVPANRITAILNGERDITPDTALRLGHYFGTSARFWLNLQTGYDLRKAEIEMSKTDGLRSITPRKVAAAG
jgi:addiction module HigA family antidote